MTKTFSCRELGGVCEEKFSGENLQEILRKAMLHMGSDAAHKEHVAQLSQTSGETKEQWMERMQQEFDARSETV